MKSNLLIFSTLMSCLIAIFSGSLTKGIYFFNHGVEEKAYTIKVSNINTENKNQKTEMPTDISVSKLSVKNGEILFKRCSLCHTIEKNGANKIGPNLWGIANKSSASNPSFAYSMAMSKKNIQWDQQNLAQFIRSPSKFVPGTKMSFAGIKDEQELMDIIAYISQFK